MSDLKDIGKRIVGHLEDLQKGIDRLSRERHDTFKQVKELRAELEALRQEHAEVEQSKLRLRGYEAFLDMFGQLLGPMTIEAARKLVKAEVGKLGGIDDKLKQMVGDMKVDEAAVRSLVKEEVANLAPHHSGGDDGLSAEEVRDEIRKQVNSMVQQGSNVVMVEPKGFLLKSVLKKEVEAIKAEVEKFAPQTRLMFGYLATTDKAVKFKDLMIRFVGSDGGSQRDQYLFPLRGIPSAVDYDSNHGVVRYMWRERMKEAYPEVTEAELDAALAQVHALIATTIVT